MTPVTKERSDSGATSAEILTGQPAAKGSVNQTGSDAVSLEVPVKVHGSRVTDVVRGITPHTEPFEEETITMIVFAHGGVLRMSTNVSSGQMLVITNIKTGQDAICRVMKVRSYTNAASYVEVEFTHELPGYWGVRFESPEPGSPKSTFPAGTPLSAVPEAREKKSPEPSLAVHPLIKAPLPKVPDPGMFPSEATRASSTAPASTAKKESETTFISIGSQEQVQPAATETVFRKKYSLPKTDAPVSSITPSANKPEKDVPAVSSSGLQIVPAANFSKIFASQGEGVRPSQTAHPAPRVEMQSTSANISPVFTAPTEAFPKVIEREKLIVETQTSQGGMHTSTPSAAVAEASAPSTHAPREMFGVRLASGEGSLAEENSESGKKWILVAAVAAVAVLGAGGFFYFRQAPAPVNSAASSSASSTQDASSNSGATQNPVTPTPSQLIADATAPLKSASGPAALASPRSSERNVREDRPEIAKGSTATSSTATPTAQSQVNSPAKPVPSAVTSSLFGTLNAHPVARHEASADSEAAPSIGNQGAMPETNNSVLGIGGSAVAAPPVAAKPSTPVRAGSQITPARMVSSVPPVYPSVARQARVQGAVLLKIHIDPTGNVAGAEVISGPSLLLPAALDAVKHWKYQPALLDGHATASETVVTLSFHL